MAKTANKLTGSGCVMRLDPYQFSHRFEAANKSYKLDHRGVVVRKRLKCGLDLSVAVPARAYKGVAGRAKEDENGAVTVSLELLHHDPELCIPLLLARDMNDIAADWHSWSRLMGLPMLLVGEDGEVNPVCKLLGDLMVEDPLERRRRITTPRHRPHFLRRRKRGEVGKVEQISAEELIARA